MVSSIDETLEGSLKIHQDAIISRIDLDKSHSFDYKLKSKNHGVYIMNVSGKVLIDNTVLESRDALGIWETDAFKINTEEDTSLLFIEVPMKF